MKVIDLLNKIANNEEVPKKIQHDGSTYIVPEDITWLLEARETLRFLNDEIEIIEEKPKKIEEFGYCCVNANGETRNFVDVEEVLKNRINELTKAVNYLLEKESDK